MPSKPAFAIGVAVAIAAAAASAVLYPLYFTTAGALLVPLYVGLYFLCGAFPAILGMGLLAFVGLWAGGIIGLLLVVLGIVPVFLVIVLLLRHRAPIHYAVLYGAGAMMTALVLWYALAMLLTRSQLIQGLVEEIRVAYDELYRQIVAQQGPPPEGSILALFSAETFPAEDFVAAISLQMLPQMARVASMGALLGAVWPVMAMRRRGFGDLVSTLAPLHAWRVPRRVGFTLAGTYLACLLLMLMGVTGAEAVMQAVFQPLLIVYSTLCLAYLSASARHRGYSKGKRYLVLILCFGIMWLLQLTVVLAGLPIIFGLISEYVLLRNGRIAGEANGPFGPPDPPAEEMDG